MTKNGVIFASVLALSAVLLFTNLPDAPNSPPTEDVVAFRLAEVTEDVLSQRKTLLATPAVPDEDADTTEEEPQENEPAAAAPAQGPEDQAQRTHVSVSRSGTRSGRVVTANPAAPKPEPQKKEPPADNSLLSETYTVKQGDTLWTISQAVGVPLTELLAANKLTEQSVLYAGMTLSVPKRRIAEKTTAGPQYGELLDWWTEAQYVWPIGKNARVIDFKTGKSFMVRRSYGAFHADVEPLTSQDAAIMKEIWGGWSWATRPVIVEVDGRRLAASANGMPHSIQTITNNNFNGHFCIHFLNSTRHKDNQVQADHQQNVRAAAGQ